ncbi:MAG: hypothetical protein V1729_06130 [Candidatus Woesearchaeota archaeon]
MIDYISHLMAHLDSGRKLVDFKTRKLDRDLLVRLYELYSGENKLSSRCRTIDGTKLCMIRPGLVLDRIIDGEWNILLGRECRGNEKIGPQGRIKTPGGYGRFSQAWALDTSVKEALFRELSEEYFKGRLSPIMDSIVPLGVLSARPNGILQFFSGKLNAYPPKEGNGFSKLKDSHDSKIFIKYFTLEGLLDELDKGDMSIVNPETVKIAATAYLWRPSIKVPFKSGDIMGLGANIEGDVSIPKSARDDLLATAGYWGGYETPRLHRCSVYFSLPFQEKVVPSLRILLTTDLFMYEKEFSPEETGLLRFRNSGQSAMYAAAAEFTKEYVINNAGRIFYKELIMPYISDGE